MEKIKNYILPFVFILMIVAMNIVIIFVASIKNPKDVVSIPYIKLDSEYTRIVQKIKGTYLGHPDTLLTSDGTLYTMYPIGHGRGAIITQKSTDFGLTYTDITSTTPSSWQNSEETPTLYTLNLTDGTEVLIMISGIPSWGGRNTTYGFNSTTSFDGGVTWSEFTRFYEDYEGIVAMSSLIQLKENGEYVDKWLCTFHDSNYTNYGTILTFDENKKEQFSTPYKLFEEHKDIESSTGMCELGISRVKDTDTIICIARANRKVSRSLICYSYDEGLTWTKPTELPNELTGDRHKIRYDEQTDKVIITFRHVPYGIKRNIFTNNKTILGSWVLWVGTFDDLLSYQTTSNALGDCIIELGHDYQGKADCGYAGLIVKDGNVHAVSYGYFNRTATKPYIMSANFNLQELLAKHKII